MIVPPVPSPVRLWGLRQWSCGEEASYYRSHHPAWGGVDEKSGNGAPVKCGWEDVVFEPRRNLGEIREVEFLRIFERVHVGRVRLIPARWWFLSKDVALC